MGLVHYIGIGLVLLGVAMVAFPRPLATGFCRLNKAIFADAPRLSQFQDIVEEVYDERSAPGIFRFLGLVNIVQGAVVLVIAILL